MRHPLTRTLGRPLRLLLGTALALAALPAEAAVYYVGQGPTCGDHPNDRTSLLAALFAASATTADDEIRLTATVSYTNTTLNLFNWHPGTWGRLTLAGGYEHCDDTVPSGRTLIDGASGNSLVTVTTTTQPSSVVTLRALELSGAEFRGLVVGASGEVTLENVWIHDNAGGVLVGGGQLWADAATEITDNDLSFDGGGIACSGAGSDFVFAGQLRQNTSNARGGNLYVGPGCVGVLEGGAILEGSSPFFDADFGGGIFVDDGSLIARGGASRVIVRGHTADQGGGGLFASGPNAYVDLSNTAFQGNWSFGGGGAIYAEDGALVTLYRATDCPFIFSCSDLRNNIGYGEGDALLVDDATVRLRHTVVVSNGDESAVSPSTEIFKVRNAGRLELNGVLVFRNGARRLFEVGTGGVVEAQYVTAADNWYQVDGVRFPPHVAVTSSFSSFAAFHSSILLNTAGFLALDGGTTIASCLLVDTATGFPTGSSFLGLALFVNAATGDLRQVPSSQGVDMCNEQLVPWRGSRDVELHVRGIDHPANANGAPGLAGGTFDAGFDEVVPPGYLFSDGFEAGGLQVWSRKWP